MAETELQHFGIMGMRWGQRKQEPVANPKHQAKVTRAVNKAQRTKLKNNKPYLNTYNYRMAYAKKAAINSVLLSSIYLATRVIPVSRAARYAGRIAGGRVNSKGGVYARNKS
jgi:hypothetical protein